MAPRGLKKTLKETVPAKFVKGKWAHFEDKQGRKLKGLHGALEERIWSGGALPSIARYGTVKRSGWKGKGGGRKRGAAVDKQLSAAVNRGKAKPAKGQYTLTKYALAALQEHKLEPVCAQRAVCDSGPPAGHGDRLPVLRRGAQPARGRRAQVRAHGRQEGGGAARRAGRSKMRDAAGARGRPHAQPAPGAAHGHARAVRATSTRRSAKLQMLGLSADVGGALLYVNDEATELYPLDDWWTKKAGKVMGVLRF